MAKCELKGIGDGPHHVREDINHRQEEDSLDRPSARRRRKTTAREGQGDGTEELATAVAELTVAGAMEDVAAAELAAGVADLTQAADAAVVAERMGVLSEVVAAAGELDIAQAIHLLSASEDVEVMSAVVGVMSRGRPGARAPAGAAVG